mmetsp:Transcript_3059/g.4209  ORF Transcript_3059/g.4209 Transcript_3059/m.4209 type:complete len:385 (+) Transcript_3059:221-1375(+)
MSKQEGKSYKRALPLKDATNRRKALVERTFLSYVETVGRYRPIFRLFEDAIGTCLNFLPRRYMNDAQQESLSIEKYFSVLNCVTLFHDAMEYRMRCCNEENRTDDQFFFMVSVLISSLECFEILLEQQAAIKSQRKRSILVNRIELTKAALRMILLCIKTKRCWDEISLGKTELTSLILLDGGRFDSGFEPLLVNGASTHQRLKCFYSKGRRTKRRVLCYRDVSSKGLTYANFSELSQSFIAELLHVVRPAVTSYVERIDERTKTNTASASKSNHALFWVICFFIDAFSLQLREFKKEAISFSGHLNVNSINFREKEELQKRKLRLFLYILREPVWKLLTEPTAKKIQYLISFGIPILGKPFADYLMSVLTYHAKSHFMLEGSV